MEKRITTAVMILSIPAELLWYIGGQVVALVPWAAMTRQGGRSSLSLSRQSTGYSSNLRITMAQFKRDGKSADGMRMEFCKIKDRLEGCARWGERPLWYGRLREHAGR